MTTFKSGAGYTGFPQGESQGLSYLYGLSDFWSLMFQDPELIDRFLETNSISLADTYSKFLQLTSTISINDIQSFVHSEIKLLSVKKEDLIGGLTGTTYKMEPGVVECTYLIDRPMLPTRTLEKNVHYRIDPTERTITFHDTLENLGFPSRVLPSGETEVFFWMVEAVMDESLVFKYFGDLINVPNNQVSRIYRDLVRGLFFLYNQGPTIDSLQRGLDLVLGIPSARASEKVLLKAQNTSTGNWVLGTDTNSYEIPYGINPSIVAGDELVAGQGLVNLVEVTDHKVEDQWWLNLFIPAELMPSSTSESRFASEGSIADEVMDKYLKHNSFLVRLQWSGAFDSSNTEEIFRILQEVKPSYTYPIFVWSVTEEETLIIEDEEALNLDYQMVDVISEASTYIERNVNKPEQRSTVPFIHSNYEPSSINLGLQVDADMDGVNLSQATPLYNTSYLELIGSFDSIGVTIPQPVPKVFTILNVPIDQAAYDAVVVREPNDPGIHKNTGYLDLPLSETHYVYSAFVPDIADLNATESFFVVEMQSNVYSVFLYRP